VTPIALAATQRQPAASLGPRANRTISRIHTATREVLLSHGYTGTTIDEIAKAAGVSRGSFYTYFPTKRDALLAVGARSAAESAAMVDEMVTMEQSMTALTDWVDRYFVVLDHNGAFAFAWTQAAHHDDEIREAGTKGHLRLCLRFGNALATWGGIAVDDPTALGIAIFSMLERAWDYCRLYGEAVDESELRKELARNIWASTHAPSSKAQKKARS
jgi:AcrR family transcriptional regulator